MASHKAHAAPTKDFFVRMITKDISLEDCILDLIDNCLDGARKSIAASSGDAKVVDYSGYEASITLSAQGFEITDNCGGISIAEAIDYAFHFGRRPSPDGDEEYSIGLYGIGMKRAIFKMGNLIDIFSSTKDEAFTSQIDVKSWQTVDDWDFDMYDAPVVGTTVTKISVTQLYNPVATQFGNPAFANLLSRIVGRDYAQFISKGFAIKINNRMVPGFPFTVRQSEEFRPIRLTYEDEEGISVEIFGGMAGLPPDDVQPQEGRAETDYFGWYVLCNDRVVVAADKTNQTVWGDDGFPNWHFQYNGFIGLVSFESKDPSLLPWRTTKRDVDVSSAIYRRAIERMKDVARSWINYTNNRKSDLLAAKASEAMAVAKPLFAVAMNAKLEVPSFAASKPKISVSSIQYTKPSAEISKVKALLGNVAMSNIKAGELTFEYFLKNEAGE